MTIFTPIRAALWHEKTEIEILDVGIGNWGFVTGESKALLKTTQKVCDMVPTVTINSLMADYQISTIDILKVDIEGAEKEVFSHCNDWIGQVDSLIVELHERFKQGCNRTFYEATSGFKEEWTRGENIYLSRGSLLKSNK